jgi:hypothetical protein
MRYVVKIQDGSSGFQHRRLPSRPVEFHHQSPTGACPAFAGSYLPVVTGITECRTGYLYRGADTDFDAQEAGMNKLVGIDLHSNNSVVVVSDEADRITCSA